MVFISFNSLVILYLIQCLTSSQLCLTHTFVQFPAKDILQDFPSIFQLWLCRVKNLEENIVSDLTKGFHVIHTFYHGFQFSETNVCILITASHKSPKIKQKGKSSTSSPKIKQKGKSSTSSPKIKQKGKSSTSYVPENLIFASHYENLPMQYTEIFLALKIENFQLKKFDIFLIFAQNIDCGYTLEPPRRGGSNEYPQSMFWSKNKKNRYTPAYPSFTI